MHQRVEQEVCRRGAVQCLIRRTHDRKQLQAKNHFERVTRVLSRVRDAPKEISSSAHRSARSRAHRGSRHPATICALPEEHRAVAGSNLLDQRPSASGKIRRIVTTRTHPGTKPLLGILDIDTPFGLRHRVQYWVGLTIDSRLRHQQNAHLIR